jgi:transposase-like protein
VRLNLARMCPRCNSSFLWIRSNAGMERIMIWLTGERKYRCNDCALEFREVDRRRVPRAEIDAAGFPDLNDARHAEPGP